MTKIHYTYKITNLNPTDERLYYIGVRSTTKSSPELDTNYRSSSKYLKEAIKEIGHTNFSKEILNVWETRKLANQDEIRLHNLFEVAKNPTYYNKAKATSDGFDTTGYVTVLDLRDNKTKNVLQEDFWKHDYYQATTSGQTTVIDTRTNKSKNVSVSDFNKYDYYIHTTKNTVSVINKQDGFASRISSELFNSSLEYEHTTKHTLTIKDSEGYRKISVDEYNASEHNTLMVGMVVVIDTRDNKKKTVSVQDFKKYEYYTSIHKNRIFVINTINDTIQKVFESDLTNNTHLIKAFRVLDIRTNKVVYVSQEESEKKHYTNPTSKTIIIYDENDNIVHTSTGPFKKFCQTNNLPYRGFYDSSKNNGMRLYMKGKVNPTFEEYKGWYAKIVA